MTGELLKKLNKNAKFDQKVFYYRDYKWKINTIYIYEIKNYFLIKKWETTKIVHKFTRWWYWRVYEYDWYKFHILIDEKNIMRDDKIEEFNNDWKEEKYKITKKELEEIKKDIEEIRQTKIKDIEYQDLVIGENILLR